jgi:hypothetical protein
METINQGGTKLIIEDLIRLGRPLLEGEMTAQETLALISDNGDEKAKNFFRHVFVAEIPPLNCGHSPAALDMQVWGAKIGNGKDFAPDTTIAGSAPFTLPAGGNPLLPQGSYGAPVYLCYDAHLGDYEKHSFRKSSDNVKHFLEGRLQRTPSIELDADTIDTIANLIHTKARELSSESPNKILGLLILAQVGDNSSLYEYSNTALPHHIGQSQVFKGKYIVPRFEQLLEAVWSAKVEEGANIGRKQGQCTICGEDGELVSSYCKSWPWALPEWNCPLPNGGKVNQWIDGLSFDRRCYKSLVLGSRLFSKLTLRIHPLISHELFAPVDNTQGRQTASRRKLSDLPAVQGAAYLLPLHDESLTDDAIRDHFVQRIQAMINRPPKDGAMAAQYIDTVVGFDLFLPAGIEKRGYRLTLVYFHGNPGRGDIHLRAIIEDVIPSTLRRMDKIARKTADLGTSLLKTIYREPSAKQISYYRTRFRSLPYLVSRAYGGSYLWEQLRALLRRKPLDIRRPTANAAKRLNGLGLHLPDSYNELCDEVLFYQTFLKLVIEYHRQMTQLTINKEPETRRSEMTMRPWKELLKLIESNPAENLHYESVAELGFGCGVLIRQFSRQYWVATKTGQQGKDYLKHRVMTFGSDLSPALVWKKGLAKIIDVATRFDQLRLSTVFEQGVGMTLSELVRREEEVESNRDAFMAAFWSGYALQGYDKPKKKEQIPPSKTEIPRD